VLRPGGGARRDQRGWRSHAQLLSANRLAAEVRQLPGSTTPPHHRHDAGRVAGAPHAGGPGWPLLGQGYKPRSRLERGARAWCTVLPPRVRWKAAFTTPAAAHHRRQPPGGAL